MSVIIKAADITIDPEGLEDAELLPFVAEAARRGLLAENAQAFRLWGELARIRAELRSGRSASAMEIAIHALETRPPAPIRSAPPIRSASQPHEWEMNQNAGPQPIRHPPRASSRR